MQIEIKIKKIGLLQTGDKRDGSGKWYAKDIVLEVCDGTRFPDEFVARLTGESAQSDELKVGQLCQADISFSTREYNGRYYQDSWLRSLEQILPVKAKPNTEVPADQTSDDTPF